jgi:hypothetical protein
MKIALIRREYITHLDGVNRFIALLGDGTRKLGHEVEVFSWCYESAERERLEELFREINGLGAATPIYTLHKDPCKGDPWARMTLDWFFEESKRLKSDGFEAVIVNGVVLLRFKPKMAVNRGIAFKAIKL